MESTLKKPKTPKDERFIEALDAVKKRFSLNDLEFVKKHKIHKDKISKTRTGLRSVKDEEISILENNYLVNGRYIYRGEGSIFVDEYNTNETDIYEERMLFDLRHSLDQEISIDILKASYKRLYDKYSDLQDKLRKVKEVNKD
jgi:hypothetical protein